MGWFPSPGKMHRMDVSLKMYIIIHFSTHIYTNTVCTTVGINKPGPLREKAEKSIMGEKTRGVGEEQGRKKGGGVNERRGHAKRKTRLSSSTAYPHLTRTNCS